MKLARHEKIIELIKEYDIDTSGLKMGQRTAEEKQQAASPSHKIASVSNSKPSIFPKQK